MRHSGPNRDSGPDESIADIDAARRVLPWISVLGPLFFFSLVTVLGVVWEGYDPIRDTQSELGAVDSPNRVLMNVAGFMGLGVWILAFSAAYYLILRPSPAKILAAGLLVIAGASMITVGFYPCDPGCVDLTPTGRLHSIFSMPGAIGLPVAAMVSGVAFRSDGRFGKAWQVLSFGLGLLTLASGPIVAAESAVEING